jgi:5'-3' exonuclease
LSGALATLLTAGRTWRQCRDQLLAAYPASKRQRRERFAEVMAGQSDYTATELDAELPDLRRTLAALGVAGEAELGADRFVELLRERALLLRQRGNGSRDLGAAIRQELGSGVAGQPR